MLIDHPVVLGEYLRDELTRAIGASTTRREPMEFILDNGGYFSVNKVDYHGARDAR